MPHRAPLVIGGGGSPKPDKVAPVFDQHLCAASAVLMMQLAACALGYGGVWRSGWLMYDRGLHQELGLKCENRSLAFSISVRRPPIRMRSRHGSPRMIFWSGYEQGTARHALRHRV